MSKVLLVEVHLLDKIASIEDFLREVELFNNANRDIIQAEVVDPEVQGRIPVLLSSSVIKKIIKLYPKYGYNLPETEQGMADIIEDLIISELESEFGVQEVNRS